MNLVILVSGRGSRLKKKTKSKPKCLTKIHKNKTIIDFISECFCFAKNQFENCVFAISARFQRS